MFSLVDLCFNKIYSLPKKERDVLLKLDWLDYEKNITCSQEKTLLFSLLEINKYADSYMEQSLNRKGISSKFIINKVSDIVDNGNNLLRTVKKIEVIKKKIPLLTVEQKVKFFKEKIAKILVKNNVFLLGNENELQEATIYSLKNNNNTVTANNIMKLTEKEIDSFLQEGINHITADEIIGMSEEEISRLSEEEIIKILEDEKVGLTEKEKDELLSTKIVRLSNLFFIEDRLSLLPVSYNEDILFDDCNLRIPLDLILANNEKEICSLVESEENLKYVNRLFLMACCYGTPHIIAKCLEKNINQNFLLNGFSQAALIGNVENMKVIFDSLETVDAATLQEVLTSVVSKNNQEVVFFIIEKLKNKNREEISRSGFYGIDSIYEEALKYKNEKIISAIKGFIKHLENKKRREIENIFSEDPTINKKQKIFS